MISIKQNNKDTIAVRLAQIATTLLIIICFLVLPIWWLQIMIKFSTIHLINLQQQQQIYNDCDPWSQPIKL